MAKFTVDTHLFRELGELLVGRDSTALVELIKNAYDADAFRVTVHGENLGQKALGKIVITDNGSGMTAEQFQNGFLRIASRLKDTGERRSDYYGRRYTGAKGIGRLAAHKLACHVSIESVPRDNDQKAVSAIIDWDEIEKLQTLDEVEAGKSVMMVERDRAKGEKNSTVIELTRLRRKWTPGERTKLFLEVASFQPARVLLRLPDKLLEEKSILEEIKVNDVQKKREGPADPGFDVSLTGDFAVGEDYWHAVAMAANWVIEIKAEEGSEKVKYNIAPTRRCQAEYANEGLSVPKRLVVSNDHPSPKEGPFFKARILVREGPLRGSDDQKAWHGHQSGIRVFMEGFRVLPYGEPSDDWLEIDADYAKRERSLRFLDGFGESDEDEGLSHIRKTAYFGGIFLTQAQAASLRMLVNREGFVPDESFERMKEIVRVGVDLSVRSRAAARRQIREQRSEDRLIAAQEKAAPKKKELKQAVEDSVEKAAVFAREARAAAAHGDVELAARLIDRAANEFRAGSEINQRLLTERGMMRILSGVGLQMAAFVHEINGLLGMIQSIEQTFERLQRSENFSASTRHGMAAVRKGLADLRRIVERQASYLADVTAPDARRKRARLLVGERFEAAMRLISPAIERRSVRMHIHIADDLKTPPMFPAELMVVFSNLLTNAVKGAGENGEILVRARESNEGDLIFRIENNGSEVDLDESERWFQPFETTTAKPDPILGQGMGMGLPITRNILEEYGAVVQFVKPTKPYVTAVEIRFPGNAR